MGIVPKSTFSYSPNNYIVTFSWKKEPSYLFLCYNEDKRFRFVDLKAGNLLTLSFDNPQKAEEWLNTVTNVHEKNAMEITYVP